MAFEQLITQYRENRLNRKVVKRILKDMYNLANEYSDSFINGRYYYYVAENHYFFNELDKTRIFLDKAYNVLAQYPTSKELVSCLNLYGILADLRQDHTQAIEYYFQALEVGEQIGSHMQVMVILNNIGNLFLMNEAYKESIVYYRKCLKICKELSKSQRIDLEATFRQNLATVYAQGGYIKQAKNQIKILENLDESTFRGTKYFTINYLKCFIACSFNENEDLLELTNTLEKYITIDLPLESVRMIFEIMDLWLEHDLFKIAKHGLDICYKIIENNKFKYFYKDYNYACLKYYRKIEDEPNTFKYALEYLKNEQQQLKTDRANRLISLKDKVELFDINKKLQQSISQSITDQLTGLYNRHILNSFVQEKFERSKAKNNNVSLIMIDIDYFKLYNDKQGHLEGDKCLKNIASIIKEFDEHNIISMRYGGDEFIIMLFNKNNQEVLNIAEALQAKVNNLHYYYSDDKTKTVTLSQGIYFAKPYPDESIFDFIRKADKALYRAKKTKNCIEVY